MYYLTFLLPEVRDLLERHGFTVEEHPLGNEFPASQFQIVIATRSRPS